MVCLISTIYADTQDWNPIEAHLVDIFLDLSLLVTSYTYIEL